MGSIGANRIDYEVAVIGAGFSGIYELHKLKEAGFNARIYEAGSGVGGIWHWNSYPGARVDTPVPTYQLTDDESWLDWNWTQRFPDYAELRTYFTHLVKVWGLSDLITFNTRVQQLHWNEQSHAWHLNLRQTDGTTLESIARHVIVATGFGSKPYIPPFKGLDTFKGEFHHTGLWPKGGVSFEGKRVGIIGTGASGVQLIQETAKTAKHLTVFQRTPNTALPMINPKYDVAANDVWKKAFPDTRKAMFKTHAGFDYEFLPESSLTLDSEVKKTVYQGLLGAGGLNFWLGTYRDVLFDQTANDEAYEFWRQSVLPRIKDPKNKEILAPKVPCDPFGTKRVSLETRYFEVFDQENVDLVNLRANNIDEVLPDGVRTADGTFIELDVLLAATGFDSVTGAITAIDIYGLDPGLSVKEKWAKGTYTLFGLSTSGFPNLFFMYGPQAPTAFATGPISAECQGLWLTTLLSHLRDENLTKIDADPEAERSWREHVLDLGEIGLYTKAKSWYYGDNIPGKPREALNYMAGLPMYRAKLEESASKGYEGFTLSA